MMATKQAAKLLAALVAAGVIGGAGVEGFHHLGVAHAAPVPAAVSGPTAIAPGTVTPPNFTQITREWGPAIVNVTVDGTRKTSDDQQGNGDDEAQDPFDFFRNLPGMPQSPGRRGELPVRGTGSGFI